MADDTKFIDIIPEYMHEALYKELAEKFNPEGKDGKKMEPVQKATAAEIAEVLKRI